jgi:hypothetical protein
LNLKFLVPSTSNKWRFAALACNLIHQITAVHKLVLRGKLKSHMFELWKQLLYTQYTKWW